MKTNIANMYNIPKSWKILTMTLAAKELDRKKLLNSNLINRWSMRELIWLNLMNLEFANVSTY